MLGSYLSFRILAIVGVQVGSLKDKGNLKFEQKWWKIGEDSWESLGSKEIKPVNPKGSQPWIFIGRTDAEGEAPILWPPDDKSQLIRKDPDAGKDWGQEEKGMTEDEMVGWLHWLNGHEFEQTPGDSEGGKPGLLQSMGS